jgi:hypothetical protein
VRERGIGCDTPADSKGSLDVYNVLSTVVGDSTLPRIEDVERAMAR